MTLSDQMSLGKTVHFDISPGKTLVIENFHGAIFWENVSLKRGVLQSMYCEIERSAPVRAAQIW